MDQFTAQQTLYQLLRDDGNLVVMTGAGVSADSGIPTFRGKDGFWTVGSREYRPQELATFAMFQSQPKTVWAFYVDRLLRYRDARPNAGHRAIVELERQFGDRFRLLTQNIDGLHFEAGSSRERTFAIHGDIRQLRCSAECSSRRWPFPVQAFTTPRDRDQPLSESECAVLRCEGCGAWARPHVLWFDEYYDEENFYFDSSLRAAAEADLLLVVGTSGATNLPLLVARECLQAGCRIIEVNPERTSFTEAAEQSGGGFIAGSSTDVLPKLVEGLARTPDALD